MIDRFTKQFIETHKQYIANEDWEGLYAVLEKFNDVNLIPKLTRTLLNAGINPLEGMNRVPTAFALGIKRLKSIDIPQGVIVIQNMAFEGTKLSSIEIPNSVVEIQAHSFRDCSELSSIIIPASIKKIGACAFYESATATIQYLGTEEQWDKIELGKYWWTNPNIAAGFVHCIDNTLQYPLR